VSIYIAHYQKISNALSTYRQYSAEKCVFSWHLIMLRISAGSRRLSGSEFQVDGPTTARHQQPTLLVVNIGSLPVIGSWSFRAIVWTVFRRCWRPATSVVGVQLFIRYNGAVPWRHRYISTSSLNCTRSLCNICCATGSVSTDTSVWFLSLRRR